MIRTRFTVLFILLLLLQGCSCTKHGISPKREKKSECSEETTNNPTQEEPYGPNHDHRRLHDIWITTHIEGDSLPSTSPIPMLEINLTEMRVIGHDGCNRFHGKIQEVSENNITLSPIASTLKRCSAMEVPNRFHEAINRVEGYKLEGLRLILTDKEGNEVLTFLKGD
ncbi:MAG: hypothetical protein CSA95_04785 [Bacteroidetes bacterium]|nr:MAG: hypothetical protein CSA95_04785 [Bacteroidota bacterium]PIE88688.1 MAG: hypothetical protein CSA04_00595 [Bacteroidota bacterium]